jgi:hypothetical protein
VYFILSKVGFAEGLKGIAPDTSISDIMNPSAAFCESHKGSSGDLDKACGRLTQGNCNDTSCCVWRSPGKCVAGGMGGPTFNTDENGKTEMLDYYYFNNKCYGGKCK